MERSRFMADAIACRYADGIVDSDSCGITDSHSVSNCYGDGVSDTDGLAGAQPRKRDPQSNG
jgi:hypothetical protein